ncbi:uncharacterized protein K460DRAFT_433157 [Cucurbitaria berberidis CBS 394.84]|uniref:Thioredoxin-like fold domain-containing protein n=1 Tax=Cucurbitaria berberidis CBS 394.84 TaxID=1168544 RepID=A0A9P4GD99_9PLEO|nr:uncharacterized protein K460DRAFT_433157 [Cucurbitaria berberidis CBS 394.84]KAF1843512.1 hypothetical protein K460DRAFT_433157 [Cucurbitaria berberidis CBS 394.84]
MDSQPNYKLVVSRGTSPHLNYFHRTSDSSTRAAAQYVWSPHVAKLELCFRLSKLSYESNSGGPLNVPRGKIPCVEISTPGSPSEWVADSLIAKDFIHRGLLQDMNARISGKETGQDLAIRALLEYKLFFYNAHERWTNNYYTVLPQRYLFGYFQGTGRFMDGEIHTFREEIWAGVHVILEDSRRKATQGECFWVSGGDEPCEADATVYGFAISALVSDSGPMGGDLVKSECPAVLEYATKIHQRYFPDHEVWK